MTVRPPTGKLPRNILFQFGAYYLRFKNGRGQWKRQVCKARTLGEAKVLLGELEKKAYRQRLGLEALPADDGEMTLAEACDWWLKNHCPERSQYREEKRLQKHVIKNPALAKLGVGEATPEHFLAYFKALSELGRSPSTINRLRAILHCVYSELRSAKPPLFTGANPLADTETRRVPKRKHNTLDPEQIEPVLAAFRDPMWQCFAATGVYMALRKGELCGLLKSAVDLKHQELLVAASYDHGTTKGNKEVSLPIPDALVPYLRRAMAMHPKSKFVFSRADGEMLSEDSNPEKVLRTALKRAGIVEGFEHSCRRCNRGWKEAGRARAVEMHPDDEQRRCPTCNMKLHAEPKPIRMVFHDLRHSTATILIRKGTPLPIVQKLLRHSKIDTTVGTYFHVVDQDLRDALNGVAPPAPNSPTPAGAQTKSELVAQAMELLARAQTLPDTPAAADGRGQPVVSHLKVVKG